MVDQRANDVVGTVKVQVPLVADDAIPGIRIAGAGAIERNRSAFDSDIGPVRVGNRRSVPGEDLLPVIFDLAVGGEAKE